MRYRILFFFLAFIGISQFVTSSDVRNKYNFNSDWLLYVGDVPEAKQPRFSDSEWKKVTLPHAFNEDEAFRLSIDELTDTIMWYRKHFRLPADSKNKKVFVEFEGVRQGADFYINGQNVGLHENGVMAVGFDLTPYIKYGQENVIIKNGRRARNTSGAIRTLMPIMAVSPKMYGCTSPTVCIRLYLYIVISKRPESTSMPKTSV